MIWGELQLCDINLLSLVLYLKAAVSESISKMSVFFSYAFHYIC